MSAENVIEVAGFLVSIGIFVGVTRTQTKSLEKSIDKLGERVDKCVTKTDFPAFFAREKTLSGHDIDRRQQR